MALLPPIGVTATSAVATNGTLTFGYPARVGATTGTTTQGDFKGSFGHTAYAEGLQTALKLGPDFTLTFGNSNITFTYKGTSTIPANTVVQLQLNTLGQNSQSPYGIQLSGSSGDAAAQANSGPAPQALSTRVQEAGIVLVNFGTPVTASATSIINAATRADATLQTAAFTLDVPRTLQYVCGSAGDTTQTHTMTGTDEYGVAMSETVTLNGTTVVHGKKAFKTTLTSKLSAGLTTTLSVGSDTKLGLPMFLAEAGMVIKDVLNGATATAGTYVAGDLTTPSATTGDVRGTYDPNSAPSTNTNTYESYYACPTKTVGLTQA